MSNHHGFARSGIFARRDHPEALPARSAPSDTQCGRTCRRASSASTSAACPAPFGRDDRPVEGIVGYRDALYALAYSGSGDADTARQAVVDAFTDACSDPATTPGCPARLWRALADRVHLMGPSGEVESAADPAPFRQGALSPYEREAIALLLAGWRESEAAQLLGVSRSHFDQYVQGGLQAVQPFMVTGPPIENASGAIGDDDLTLPR